MKWYGCAALCAPRRSIAPTETPMPERFSDRIQQNLSDRLRFYEDIGISTFYRDRAGVRPTEEPPTCPRVQEVAQRVDESDSLRREPKPAGTAPTIPARKFELRQADSGPSLFESSPKPENDTLLNIREDLGDCKRCRLHKTRHSIVFGDGNPKAQLVFVGEGPGADEDAQGLPFVGRAGKLLTQMIEAMGLQRRDVYICNVVKCRPPGNRQPEPDEVTACSPFLFRQLDSINPKVIVCLGATAFQTLLQTNRSISHYRGQWLDYRGYKMLPTYHPAYLLRNPAAKAEVWKDLQKVMAELGLEVKKKAK